MFAELHTHLGGATSPQTLFSIAYDRGFNIKRFSNYENFSNLIRNGIDSRAIRRGNEFTEYLDRYKMIQEICSYPQSIQESVYKVLEDLYINHNYRLVELKFNPALRNQKGLYDLDSIILSACNGIQKAKNIFKDLECGIIIESDQSFPLKLTQIIFEKAVKFKNFGVIGVDISGFYGDYSHNLYGGFYKEVFKYVKDNGLKITLHLGETLVDVPKESERKSLEDFKSIIEQVDRIGHGVQFLLYSKFATDLIRALKIPIEFCPNSNLKTKVINQEEIETVVTKAHYNDIDIVLCTDGHVFNGNFEDNLKTIQHCVKDKDIFEVFKNSVSNFDRTKKHSFINIL